MEGTSELTDDVRPEANKSSNSGKPATNLAQDHDSDLPIDRGYAWVIVLGCMLSNMICLGLQRAYGILFVEFLHLFSLPASLMSLVMAIQSAATSVASLLTQTVMLSLLSERQTIVIGGVCGGVGIILSYFATNVSLLILTQSVLVGSANGIIMGPTQVIVSKYFFQRRSFALACSTLGGNLGSMVMPVFTEFLLERYGVRGSLLVLGAFFLNIAVFAGLLRPLHQNKPRRKKKDTRAEGQALKDDTVDDTQRGHWRCVPERTDLDLQMQRLKSSTGHLWVSNPDIALAANINRDDDVKDHQDDRVENDGDGIADNNDKNEQERQPLKNNGETATSRALLDLNQENHKAHDRSIGESADSLTLKEQKKKSVCAKFLSFFDFKLFKRPPFLLIMVSCSLANMPAALFGMYLPALAADKGIVGQKAALLLTVFGGVGIFARLGFGYLADKNFLRRAYLMALLLSLSCTTGLFTPLYNTYSLLIFFSVTYGLFGIIFFSLLPVVVVDLIGIHNMAKTLGFVQLFQGIVLALAHPVIGHLRDVTGNYHASYYFLSVTGLFCAFLLLFTPCVLRDSSTNSKEV